MIDGIVTFFGQILEKMTGLGKLTTRSIDYDFVMILCYAEMIMDDS